MKARYSVMDSRDGRDLVTVDPDHLVWSGDALDYFEDVSKAESTAINMLARAKARYSFDRTKEREEKAQAEASEVIKRDPKLVDAYLWRAGRCVFHDADQAHADCTTAIRLNPKSSWAYFLRARSAPWYDLSPAEFVAAAADYIQALRLDPTWPHGWKTYIEACEDVNAEHEARAEADQIRESTVSFFEDVIPKHPQLLAQPLSFSGRKVHVAPLILQTYLKQATRLEQNVRYREAIAMLTKCIELEAKSKPRQKEELAKAYRHRAWILATCPIDAIRDGGRAVVDAKRAMELSDGTPLGTSAQRTLAAAYAEQGEFDLAVKSQQEVPARRRTKQDRARLQYFQANRPYREKAGVDLVQYADVPSEVAAMPPPQVVALFHAKIAKGDVKSARNLILPNVSQLNNRTTAQPEQFARFAREMQAGHIQFVSVASRTEGDEAVVIVEMASYGRKDYRPIFLTRTLVGWLIRPAGGLPMMNEGKSPTLRRWFYGEQAKLAGVQQPAPQPNRRTRPRKQSDAGVVGAWDRMPTLPSCIPMVVKRSNAETESSSAGRVTPLRPT